jgi:tetratricopeptide (TPR) repeat protein
MKISHRLLLCLSATALLTIVFPPSRVFAQRLSEAGTLNSNLDSTAEIIRQERDLLKQPPSREVKEQLQVLHRQLLAEALELTEEVSTPLSQTAFYFENLYQQYPTSGLLAILYANALAEQPESANQVDQIYRDAIQANPTHPLLHSAYAWHLERQGTEQGIAVLEEAIRAQPQNLESYLNLASFQPDDSTTVLAAFDRAIAAVPHSVETYIQFAQFGSERNVYLTTQLIERVVAGQERLPQSPELYVALAPLYQQANRPQRAIETLEQAIALGSENTEFLHLMMAEVYTQENQLDRALSHYHQSLAAGGGICYGDFSDRALNLQAQGRGREIFQLLENSLQQNAANPDAIYGCLEVMYRLAEQNGEFRQATIDLMRPRILENENYLFAMFSLMMQEKQYSEIVRIGENYRQQNLAMSAGTLSLMGDAAHASNHFDQATVFYLAAEAREKEIYGVARSSSSTVQHPELLASVRWHLGAMHLDQGNTDQAIEQFELATQAWPDFSLPVDDSNAIVSFVAIAYNSLGEIYQSQGETTAARRSFEAAIADSEGYEIARENLARLR